MAGHLDRLWGLIRQLTTLADNVTPSQRKIQTATIGLLGIFTLAMYNALAWYSVVVMKHEFQMESFGLGAAAIIGVLITLPMSLAKAMQWVPDTTAPPNSEGDVL